MVIKLLWTKKMVIKLKKILFFTAVVGKLWPARIKTLPAKENFGTYVRYSEV